MTKADIEVEKVRFEAWFNKDGRRSVGGYAFHNYLMQGFTKHYTLNPLGDQIEEDIPDLVWAVEEKKEYSVGGREKTTNKVLSFRGEATVGI